MLLHFIPYSRYGIKIFKNEPIHEKSVLTQKLTTIMYYINIKYINI